MQAGPEVVIAGPLDGLLFLLGLEGVRGGVQAFWEQSELVGVGASASSQDQLLLM
ncbi:hypothetical protein [Streptomyces canus]|uniref:hypothetical protein n=1 Tax=Streptomyces canus TaxID=58343 RepID=UPI00324D3FAF